MLVPQRHNTKPIQKNINLRLRRREGLNWKKGGIERVCTWERGGEGKKEKRKTRIGNRWNKCWNSFVVSMYDKIYKGYGFVFFQPFFPTQHTQNIPQFPISRFALLGGRAEDTAVIPQQFTIEDFQGDGVSWPAKVFAIWIYPRSILLFISMPISFLPFSTQSTNHEIPPPPPQPLILSSSLAVCLSKVREDKRWRRRPSALLRLLRYLSLPFSLLMFIYLFMYVCMHAFIYNFVLERW